MVFDRRMDVPPPRMHGIVARDAPVAVIFRRGPTRWVEVISVDLANDHVERGAWFHGRIYEQRCDLSPDGALMVYFATPHRRRDPSYGSAWTAVSRPPWLTALALWPKTDTYNGGGVFTGRRELWINDGGREPAPHPDHRPER